MKSFLTQSLLGAAAFLCISAANASVVTIDFENLDTSGAQFAPLMAGGDYVTQGNLFVQTQDVNGGNGLVGRLSNGSDPTSCLSSVCPTGNSSNFLSVVNDGLVHLGNFGGNLVFSSLDAAYIATPGNPAGSTVFLAIEADRDDGTFAAFYYALTGDGAFQTITSSTVATGSLGGSGTLTSGTVTNMFIFSYFCNGSTGGCSNFSTNLGQFALDNISFVPEPASLLLTALGLGAAGVVTRRRRSV